MGHPLGMLIEAYIEALMVDEELADLAWEAWNIGRITDDLAAMVWAILAIRAGLQLSWESAAFAMRRSGDRTSSAPPIVLEANVRFSQ